MGLGIKDKYITEANSNHIKAYLLSKALRKEVCTDAEMKKIYKMSDAEFDVAADILIKEGIAEKK